METNRSLEESVVFRILSFHIEMGERTLEKHLPSPIVAGDFLNPEP